MKLPHYATLCSFCHFFPLMSKLFSQQSVLRYPQSMLIPLGDGSSFTPIQKNR